MRAYANIRVRVVVGAQYGSEAKGHVTARLIQQETAVLNHVLNIRVAGPNAGHSVVDAEGKKWAFRQIPVGAVQPGVALAIAPGSEIDPAVLIAEIQSLRGTPYDIRGRLTIHPSATIITEEHRHQEGSAGLVGRIGSTGKGIGAARASRIMRTAVTLDMDRALVGQLLTYGVRIGAYHPDPDPDVIVIEGTQGYGLGLHTPYYPYTTSSDCTALDFLAMAQINPWTVRDVDVVMAARVYPIRVAGSSGPMYRETSWEQLGLPAERTTVTKKVRRVGHWDPNLVHAAARANGSNDSAGKYSNNVSMVITMIDQIYPELAGSEDPDRVAQVAKDDLQRFSRDARVPITGVTTSDRTGVWL